MNTKSSRVLKIVISEIPSLDPVSVIIDDMGVGRGSITLCCYGKAWTFYGGSLGEQRIAEFFCTAHDDYLCSKFMSGPHRVIDYEAISRRIGEDVDVTTLLLYEEQIADAYGPDWRFDLPEKPCPDYTYLRRIVRATQEGLRAYFGFEPATEAA